MKEKTLRRNHNTDKKVNVYLVVFEINIPDNEQLNLFYAFVSVCVHSRACAFYM